MRQLCRPVFFMYVLHSVLSKQADFGFHYIERGELKHISGIPAMATIAVYGLYDCNIYPEGHLFPIMSSV